MSWETKLHYNPNITTTWTSQHTIQMSFSKAKNPQLFLKTSHFCYQSFSKVRAGPETHGLNTAFKILSKDHSPCPKCLPNLSSLLKGGLTSHKELLLCEAAHKLLCNLTSQTLSYPTEGALTFLFLSRCLRTATAFLIR